MSRLKSPTICIIAGETSGDLLGGYLACAIKTQKPSCRLIGVGMSAMQNAGVDILIDARQLVVMGLFEVIAKFSVLRRSMRLLTRLFTENPPDLLILIDYPGFNLRLAAKAKALGIKVMYYVSPQIWAWHYNRIKIIKRNIDRMAVLFPFEKTLYEKENVPVTLVGHPLMAHAKPTLSRHEAFQHFKLDPKQPIIGLLPGSRVQEIQRLLPDMLQAVKRIQTEIPMCQFILPLAPHLSEAILAPYDLNGIHITKQNRFDALQLCDSAIVASGTVTLEIALLQVPMVILYKVNAITAFIAQFIPEIKKMVKGKKCFGLCNIVAEEALMPELLQHAVTPYAIYTATLELLNNHSKRQYIQNKLATLAEKLDSANAADKAARTALNLVLTKIRAIDKLTS